jgi:antitoxin (DNA-binding transcriptional repressor) of toxin-antitoxin stability system
MTVTLAQAQADLAGLIRRLSPGDELLITENDRTVARLTAVPPPSPKRREPGLLKGMITIVEDDDEHLKDFEEYMQ